jgi:7-cyano-7-deazaguanine synthase
MKGLILLSGGMDSAVMLAAYKQEIQRAIIFNYGSKHATREMEAAKKLALAHGISYHVLDIVNVGLYLKSSLIVGSQSEVPDGHYHADNMKSTVVPFRNGIMLSIAAGYAASEGFEKVFIAVHAGDHHIYPDCRPDFIKNMAHSIWLGTDRSVALNAPFINMTKRDIALVGRELGVKFEDTYSCYKGWASHCGTCGTCIERKEALTGFDNTIYLD